MEVTRICLDTSAYSHFKRGHVPCAKLVVAAGTVFVPTVVLGELLTGFRLGRNPEKNEQELRNFLASPAVEVIDVDHEVASIYADIVADLRAAGTPIPTNDIWIASCAVREGANVLTYDGHFKRIHRAGTRVLTV